jgi:hypothetical protein
METHFNGQPNPEKSEAGQDNNEIRENAESIDANALESHEQKKRVKHEDHNVSRKYRLFSNHSSYGDSPHTNTSI